MKADSRTEGEVLAALRKFTETYRQRDLKGLLDTMAGDADVVLYGTGADEKRIGLEQIRAQVERDWSQSDSAAMVLDWTSVSAAGPWPGPRPTAGSNSSWAARQGPCRPGQASCWRSATDAGCASMRTSRPRRRVRGKANPSDLVLTWPQLEPAIRAAGRVDVTPRRLAPAACR